MLILYVWILILSVLWNLTDGIDHIDDDIDSMDIFGERKKYKDTSGNSEK